MNKIGLVIVNYNRGKLVANIIHTFSSYNSVSAIVIVDNCSTDNSREILCGIQENKVNCIFTESNEGYARGNNIGLKYLNEQCGCDYCFVVNPDVYFKEDIILSIVEAFEMNLEYAVITCARIDPQATDPQLQYTTRVYDTFCLQFLSYFSFVRHYYLLKKYGVYQIDTTHKCIKEIGCAPGSFFGIRMSAFPESKVLDEGTFLYGEEDFLAMKCKLTGLKIGYLPYIIYEHRHIQHSTTLSGKSMAPVKYALKSKRYFQKKYLHLNVFERLAIKIAEKICLFERLVIMIK